MLATAALAALYVGLCASPASAATIVNAKSIKVTLAGGDQLQISELQAFDFSNLNVAGSAAGGTASTNSVHSDFHGGKSTAAANANDGALPYARNYGDDPTFYTGIDENAFLQIAFAAPTTISKLTIYGRIDCCSHRDIYNVSVFDANGGTLYSGVLDATGADHMASVSFDAPVAPPGGAAVPEPATWAMMIFGFGAVGSVIRSRRRRAVA